MIFINKLLRDNTGVSSKRFVTLVTFILICIIAVVDLFTPLTISQFIFNGLMYLCSIGLGTILAQDVLTKNKYNKNNKQQEIPQLNEETIAQTTN